METWCLCYSPDGREVPPGNQGVGGRGQGSGSRGWGVGDRR